MLIDHTLDARQKLFRIFDINDTRIMWSSRDFGSCSVFVLLFFFCLIVGQNAVEYQEPCFLYTILKT